MTRSAEIERIVFLTKYFLTDDTTQQRNAQQSDPTKQIKEHTHLYFSLLPLDNQDLSLYCKRTPPIRFRRKCTAARTTVITSKTAATTPTAIAATIV